MTGKTGTTGVLRKRLLPIVAVLLIFFAVQALIAAVAPQPERNESHTALTTVVTTEPQLQPIVPFVTLVGRVESRDVAVLRSSLSGRVEEVSPIVEVGAFVEKGQVLVRIDDTDQQHRVRIAEIDVASAKLQLERERAQADVALWLDKRDITTSASILGTRELEVRAAETRLQSAEVVLKSANIDLERTQIKAPYDGWILRRAVSQGGFVDKNTEVLQIIAVDPVFAVAELSQSDMDELQLTSTSLQEGANYSARIEGMNLEQSSKRLAWSGRVASVADFRDGASSTYKMHVQVEGPTVDQNLEAFALELPPFNSTVSVTVSAAEERMAYVLPRSALQDESYLWGIDEASRAHRLPVRLIDSDYDYVAVDGDLSGVHIVTSATPQLREGQEVRVVIPQQSEVEG